MKKRLISLMLLVVMILTLTVTANAASTAPYGFTYDDVANGRTVYMFYTYNKQTNNFQPTKEYYSKGNKLYKLNGTAIADTYGSSGQYNGFDKAGVFYVITPKQQLIQFKENTKNVLFNSGALRLSYNSDSIATAVVTNDGWKSLSTLKPVKPIDDDDTPTPTTELPANRIQMYTNSAGEMVYEAIQNKKLKLTLVVSKDGKRVLNQTSKIRLTDTLKGAKFVGFDSNYNVYLYEGSTLYRFKFGKWYSAEKVLLNGTYKSFTNTTSGFISKVVTSKTSYSIKQLTTSGKWKASSTYVVKKSDYQTLYIKGKTASYTLQYKSKKLSLNGKQVATNVSKYGFTSSKKVIYIKGGKCYTASLSKPGSSKLFCKNAKALVTNSKNLVTKVKLSSGKCKNVK